MQHASATSLRLPHGMRVPRADRCRPGAHSRAAALVAPEANSHLGNERRGGAHARGCAVLRVRVLHASPRRSCTGWSAHCSHLIAPRSQPRRPCVMPEHICTRLKPSDARAHARARTPHFAQATEGVRRRVAGGGDGRGLKEMKEEGWRGTHDVPFPAPSPALRHARCCCGSHWHPKGTGTGKG